MPMFLLKKCLELHNNLYILFISFSDEVLEKPFTYLICESHELSHNINKNRSLEKPVILNLQMYSQISLTDPITKILFV